MKKQKTITHQVDAIVMLLLSHGFTEHGCTPRETVRIPTVHAPVFGGCGGELATFGGRRRFVKEEERATVGPRIVCFYRVVNKNIVGDFIRFRTKNYDGIKTHLGA